MKSLTRFFLLCALLVCSFAAGAQTDTGSTAKVYLLRHTGIVGGPVVDYVYMDDKLMCKLNENRFSVHDVPAGKHEFAAVIGGRKLSKQHERITVNFEKGKTYYIQLRIEVDVFANKLWVEETTESNAKTLMDKEKMKADENCN
jgi:hypothetical protein